MRTIRVVLVILALVLSMTGFSQKVKFKKGKALIEDVETYLVEEDGSSMTLSTLSSVEFVTLIGNYYEEKNPAHYNKNNPQAYRYPQFIRKAFYTVRFLESGTEFHTDLSQKDLVKNIAKSGMVDAEGNIDEDKMNLFVNKYKNDNLKYKLVN